MLHWITLSERRVDVADELDRDHFAALRAQRVISRSGYIPGIGAARRRPCSPDIGKEPDLPKLEIDDAVERILEQIKQVRVRVDDPAIEPVKDQDAILRSLK
jgi:hypothetical protein